MKKMMVMLVTAVGVAAMAACGNGEGGGNEEPGRKAFPVGSWRTTYQGINVSVDGVTPLSSAETVKGEREQEASGAVTETESYRLIFEEDGTGTGSGVRPDGSGRWNFNFIWQLSDGHLSIVETGSVGVIFISVWNGVSPASEWIAHDRVDWEIKESSDNEMVLLWTPRFGTITTDGGPSWEEKHKYIYTLEKVK